MKGNPWTEVEFVSDRQPAYCPYCGQNGSFDGQGKLGKGYRHHCPDCGQVFVTYPPDVEL